MQSRATDTAFGPCVSAGLWGLFVGTLIAAASQIGAASQVVPVLRTGAGVLGPVTAALIIWATWKHGLTTLRMLDRLSRSSIHQADLFLITLCLVLVFRRMWAQPFLGSTELLAVPLTNALGWLAGGIEVIRWARTGWYDMVGVPGGMAPTTEGALLDRVVGDVGFEALPTLDADDPLDRQPFVETLEAAVRHPRRHSFTFGLEGPLGSGKTTVLNALEQRLRANRVVVVRFDAWSFREPQRVVGNYLDQLGDALGKASGGFGLRAALRRLGAGLAPLAPGSIGEALRAWLARDRPGSTDEALEELRKALRGSSGVVVVIVDDLDRLERPELDAALRAVYMLADLPHLVHVLAYDRTHIARALFSRDPTGQLARDYVAKIIDVEMSLSTPTPEAASRILGTALQPLLESVAEEDAKRFVDRLNARPRQVFTEAMPTPREVRRVAAATALLWPRLNRDVNLFDLFVLQMIHARFPTVFATLHLHPEWFTKQEWSGDLWRIAEGKRWDKEGSEYFKDLTASKDPEDVRASRLLNLIFPRMSLGQGYEVQPEAEARRERRIYHPEIFPRYFQLSVPRETIAESSVEDLAEKVREAPQGARVAIVRTAAEEAAKSGRARAFLEQWDVFLAKIKPGDEPLSPNIAEEAAVGLAGAAAAIPGERNDPLNPRFLLAPCIARLAALVQDPHDITTLVCRAIEACPSFAVSGDLVSLTTNAEARERVFSGRALDDRKIHGEFDLHVRNRLSLSPSPLFDLADDDLAGVLVHTQDSSTVREVFARGLYEHREALPRIVRLAVTLDVNPANLVESRAVQDELPWLHGRVNLADLHRQTESLPDEYWAKPFERALVLYFRKHYKAAIEASEARQQRKIEDRGQGAGSEA